MTIEKIDGVWAETGSKDTTITDAKKLTGFVGGDQPTNERFNQLFYRGDTATDRIIEERVNSYYDDATDAQKMIATGLWSDSWGLPSDDANIIDTGSAHSKLRDLATFFNEDGEPRVLIADNTYKKIYVYDPRTMIAATDYSESSIMQTYLPGGTWFIQSLCTDGTTVYATLKDTLPATDEYFIYAWNIETWTKKSGWPAAGTQLAPAANSKYCKGIIASSTRIAVINTSTAITAAGDPVIEIVNISTGAIEADGAGNAPTGGGYADPCITSDGTNVYFGVYESSLLYICSAGITLPSVDPGGNDFGVSTTYDAHIGAMVSAGDKIISYLNYASYATGDVVIMTHDAGDAFLDRITRGQDAQSTPIMGETYAYQISADAVFDGINVWAVVEVDLLSAGYNMALLKIDVSRLSFEATLDVSRCIDDLGGSVFLFPHPHYVFSSPQQGMTFDGRDVWAIIDGVMSHTLSGKIARLPLALLRS